jgi:hypothetical protein
LFRLFSHQSLDKTHQLLDKTVNCPVEGFHGLHVVLFDRVDDTVADMVLHDDLAGIVDRVSDGRQLDQDIAAVLVPLDHSLDGFQMTDRPGQAIDHSCLFLVTVDGMVMPAVRMGMTVGMIMVMGVVMSVPLLMVMGVSVRMPLLMVMGVDVVVLRPLPLVMAVSVRMPLLPVF